MLQQSMILFTDNFPLARLELLLLGGTIEKKITNQVMLVTLPNSFDFSDLSHSTPKAPDTIADISIQALQQWKKTLANSLI